jgi:hypothetical protein
VVVGLFGALVFIFVSGAQQLGLSTSGYVAVLVVISGIFAWLLKRLSDIALRLSQRWFPDQNNESD